MIKIDESDPIGEVDPSFPYRDVIVRKNTDMKQFYDLHKEIGRGKFGTVYRCTEKSTGLKLAAKFIGISKRQDRRNAEREVEIMRELQHPRLIQMYDAFEINNIMCVVLELIEGGELFERVIDDDFILTEKSVSVFMRQICEGIAFIHSKNILHLDMKPENILCLTRTGNRIKIIDFGLARKYDPEKKLQVLFGTPEFVAPEVVNFDSIGFGTDMWSVGVICYVLLSGLSPFMGETDVQTMANVTIAQYDFDDEAFNDISADAKEFIGKLLLKDREQRMSATECLSHRWLQRRKPPVSGTPPSNPIPQSELDLQKDTLRYLVDRWNNDTSISLVVNNEDDKCENVIDICKTNGIIEQQSKSLDGLVCKTTSSSANEQSVIEHNSSSSDTANETSNLENITLAPIQNIEAPPVSNQVFKSLQDVTSPSRPLSNLKRSLSPDIVKPEEEKDQINTKISKSLTPSRSGSSSPVICKKHLSNGEVANIPDESSQELPKLTLLEVPGRKSPQKQSSGITRSPSSPKLKKTPAKTSSPSIKDHEPDGKDEQMTIQTEIITNKSNEKLPKSPSLLEVPKNLSRIESTHVEKSPSVCPEPSEKTVVETPSPMIKAQTSNQQNQLIANHIGVKNDKPIQQIIEVPIQVEPTTIQKSPSVSPVPSKKTVTKVPSLMVKDQASNHQDQLVSNHADITSDKPSLPKLEMPKTQSPMEPITVKKSPSTSPTPLKKPIVKTPSPTIKDPVSTQNQLAPNHIDITNGKSSQQILEVSKNLSQVKPAPVEKSPSTSPTPPKKTVAKIPSSQDPSVLDKSNITIAKLSQEPPSSSLLEVPKKSTSMEISNSKKSPSTSPKPLKKKVVKTPSPSIKDQPSDYQKDIRTKSSNSATPEKSPQREILRGEKSPITVLQSTSNHIGIRGDKVQEKTADKPSLTSDVKICDIVKETAIVDKTSISLNSKDKTFNTSYSKTTGESANKLNRESNIELTDDFRSSAPDRAEFTEGIGGANTTKSKDKLQDIPSPETTNQSQPRRTPIVEISDETYECVKKRRFTIKSVESTKTINKGDSTTQVKSSEKSTFNSETIPQPHRRSIFSPDVSPKVLRKLNDFVSTSELMKRRISDISNLLSRRTEHDMAEQSIPDEMSSFCSKLNRIVRLRHDSYSIDGSSSNIKRPKFRISYLSRDVPLASTPPLHADLLNYLPFGDETISTPVWSFQKNNPFHSDPSSLRNSPERFASPSLTRKLLSKFFNDSLDYDISPTPSNSTNGLPKDKITGIIS